MALSKIDIENMVTGELTTTNGGTGATSFTAGITVGDNWRQNSNTSISSGENFLTANWERTDQNGAGQIGTALSQSSGIFTFPSTGIYYVTFELYATLENDETSLRSQVSTTIDNSSYAVAAYGSVGIQRSSGSYALTSIAQTLFDVTNTTNCKVKFGYNAAVAPSSSEIKGDTNYNQTHFIAIRLGDT
jgi:hypothetical protein|tara:strand:- start:49 stop:615 length:567 start_codon:yes stop_codon:yes gene_type:complete